LERAAVFWREGRSSRALGVLSQAPLLRKDWDALSRLAAEYPGVLALILGAAAQAAPSGSGAVEERALSARLEAKRLLDRRLIVLGTLGNSAPFIGLFGTVLGIIRAFQDLSQSAAGPEAVMRGLSQALIATAFGLLVAIPSAMAYNYYLRRMETLLDEAERLVRLLSSTLK
ncbi:MAG: MotA/TolQ/ExbB proton channel family protein, partial [Chloroflexota bacterium]